MHLLRRSAFGLIMLGLAPQGALGQQTEIVVNSQLLTVEEVAYYGVDLPPGRYWYDQVSGLWGIEGGPSVDQVAAGLPLGGPLEPDASMGNTGVFFNNREIHVNELAELLQMFDEVPPGRYWLDANLVGGIEGEPASFDLKAADAAATQESDQQASPYFEDRVTDFCINNDCPSGLQNEIDNMNSYVPNYGSE